MGGGKKQKAPKAPDYAKVAQTEAAQNRITAQELTRWNRPTQTDPYGNKISWTQDDQGNWFQHQTLSDPFRQAQQSGLAGYNQAMGLAQGAARTPFKGQVLGDPQQRNMKEAEKALDKAGGGKFENTAGNIGTFKNTSGPIKDFTNTAGTIGNFDRTQGDKVAADMYESVMGRARPEQEREKAALDVQLRQQGLQPGTEAYNRSMQNLMTSHGDVATQAGLNATQAGYGTAMDIYGTNLAGQGQRFQQLADTYGMNLAGQGQRFQQQGATYDRNLAAQNQQYQQLANTYGINQDRDWKAFQGELAMSQDQMARNQQYMNAQNQRYSQQLKNYQMPFDVAGSMANLYAAAPRPEFAGFSGATGYNPADLTGAAQAKYQSQMGAYNAGQNKKGSNMGMIGQLGSSAISAFSDANLKEDIQPLSGEEALRKILELGGYEFKWRSDGAPDLGLMAQEVQRVLPELVESRYGYLAVNYTGIVALLVAAVNYLAQELSHAKHLR